MKKMFEDLARVSDVFLEEELARVSALVQAILDSAYSSDIDTNELAWWILLMHSVLDNIVTRLPLDRRRQILEEGMKTSVSEIPIEAIVARENARIEMVASSLRLRIAEGKIGGFMEEDLLKAVEQALNKGITDFIQGLDTSLSVYDRLFMQQVANQQGEHLWVYDGPLDQRNRAFCREILLERSAYTDAGVDELNSRPSLHSYVPPNVKTLCGGYGCRHMFLPITKEKAASMGLL
jgi:hypothetical protein